MTTLTFENSTGLNLNNFPAELLILATNVSTNATGLLTIDVDNGLLPRFSADLNVLNRNLIFCQINANSIYIRDTERAMNQMQNIVRQNAEQLLQPEPTREPIAPAPATVAIMNDPDESAEDSFEVMNNDRQFPINQCLEEEILPFMATKLRNACSPNAAAILNILNQLQDLTCRTIILKNKLTELTKNIVPEDKIIKLKEQMDQLIREDNLIDKVQINKDTGWLWITTKNLQTEELEDGTKRDIGVMLIQLNLNVMLSTVTLESEHLLLKIFNKTRYVYDNEADCEFESGHIRHDGTVCLGNGYEPLFASLSRNNLLQAIDLIIKFIRNPDIDDAWGKMILHFPEVA